jgi:ribonuclease-3
MDIDRLKALQQKIGYGFKDAALLMTALTHSSYANEANQRGGERISRLTAAHASRKNAVRHNETLEFLGDAILGFIVAEALYKEKPDEKEGKLSKRRAAVICEKSLAQCARELDIGPLLIFGNNITGDGGGKQDSILSDAMEAIFAAVYLDGGFEAARGVICRCLGSAIEDVIGRDDVADYKSRLQEHFFASDKNVKIAYTVTDESGPAHKRRYTSHVTVNGRTLGAGAGDTKKESEQNAARQALSRI